MYDYKCYVDQVVDGDTVDVLIDLGFDITVKKRVRILGLDCPESRTRNLNEKSWGKAATARVIELLGYHEFVIETVIDKKEKYGRLLARIYLPTVACRDEDGIETGEYYPRELLSDRLIAEGLGIDYDGGSRSDNRVAQGGIAEVWAEVSYLEYNASTY